MGTNYYAVRRKLTLEEPIHIGKSSAGWLFAFQSINEAWRDIPVVWNTYNQVKEWLYKYASKPDSPYAILDEYDREVSFEEFVKMIDEMQKDPKRLKNSDNFTHGKNIDGYRFYDEDFS